MHLGAGVVEGRDAEKDVLPGLAVVGLLGLAGTDQRPVVVEDGLGEAGGAGGKIDGGLVLLGEGHRRRPGGAEAHQAQAVLGVDRASPAHKEEHPHPVQHPGDGVHPPDELRAEDQHLHIRQLQAVLNLLGGIPEVQGHGNAAGLEDAEIDREPFQAVHQQDAHLGPPLHPPAQQQVGEAVGLPVKVLPAHGPAVGGVRGGAFNEAGLPPGHRPVPLLRGVYLHQRRLRSVKPGVALQKLCNDHILPPLSRLVFPGCFLSIYFNTFNG